MAAANGQLLARWTWTIQTDACSPLEFYDMVEQAVSDRELPKIRFSYVIRREGGWFTPNRIYLRIRYRNLFFDVCAFVAGKNLAVSWWLHEDSPDLIDLFAEIPVIGFFIERTLRAATYCSMDTSEFVQKSIHEAVLSVADRLSEEGNLAILPDEERQPIWEEIW